MSRASPPALLGADTLAPSSRSYGSYLATHEGYFYALDALPLLCATSAFVFLWPERCLSEARSAEHQYAGTSNMEMGKQRILSRDERY